MKCLTQGSFKFLRMRSFHLQIDTYTETAQNCKILLKIYFNIFIIFLHFCITCFLFYFVYFYALTYYTANVKQLSWFNISIRKNKNVKRGISALDIHLYHQTTFLTSKVLETPSGISDITSFFHSKFIRIFKEMLILDVRFFALL